MPRNLNEPAFDLFSYARQGPGQRVRLSPTEIAHVARTVGRSPEVMVKVLSRGATDLVAVRKHVDYIARKGQLDIETDDGQKVRSRDAAEDILTDWDLEVDEHRRTAGLSPTSAKSPRLIHKLVFSMPPGTPPDKFLGAVRNFCQGDYSGLNASASISRLTA